MKIALITGSRRPIPATLGGATQTMMNHLIDVNEEKKDFEFVIYSYYEKEAENLSKKYSETKFRYYHERKVADFLYMLPYRILRKVTNGKTYIKSNFVKWCIKNINDDKPDVVIIEGNYFQTLQLRKKITIPLILHMHIDGLNVDTDNGKNILDSCKAVIAISNYCKNRIEQIDPSQKEKIYLLKNTIDTDHFCVSDDNQFRKQFRKNHGINDEDKVIIYCGRVTKVKGVNEALEAFAQLENKKTYFLIVGSNVYKDGKVDQYMKEIQSNAKKMGNRVIFTGYIPQKDLPNYYAAADISIVPSLWQEAAGNVIIESLSCDRPVVASTQGGIAEYADKTCCKLVNCDENFVSGLTTALTELIENKNAYEEMKSHARNTALKYDKKEYYKNFKMLITKIMNTEGEKIEDRNINFS